MSCVGRCERQVFDFKAIDPDTKAVVGTGSTPPLTGKDLNGALGEVFRKAHPGEFEDTLIKPCAGKNCICMPVKSTKHEGDEDGDPTEWVTYPIPSEVVAGKEEGGYWVTRGQFKYFLKGKCQIRARVESGLCMPRPDPPK